MPPASSTTPGWVANSWRRLGRGGVRRGQTWKKLVGERSMVGVGAMRLAAASRAAGETTGETVGQKLCQVGMLGRIDGGRKLDWLEVYLVDDFDFADSRGGVTWYGGGGRWAGSLERGGAVRTRAVLVIRR